MIVFSLTQNMEVITASLIKEAFGFINENCSEILNVGYSELEAVDLMNRIRSNEFLRKS